MHSSPNTIPPGLASLEATFPLCGALGIYWVVPQTWFLGLGSSPLLAITTFLEGAPLEVP